MRKHAFLIAAVALLGGCGDEPTAVAATDGLLEARGPSAEQRALAAARRATARFHRFEVAYAANYTFLFMNSCMMDPSGLDRGGMGYHYVNTDLLDADLDPATPEAVLYEPGPNGQLRLVGLEYVIPAAAWPSEDPPVLFGRELTLNAFDLWALHVWIGKRNPSGIYADWNPNVNCDNATIVAAAAHH